MLSDELSVSPTGALCLGFYSSYGEIFDTETGDALVVPSTGFQICGICHVSVIIKKGCLVMDTTWLSLD